MIRDAWLIARKDLQYMLRGKETLMWVFLMPVVFMAFIGGVTSGFGSSSAAGIPLALVTQDSGPLVGQLRHRLEQRGFRLLGPADPGFDGASRRLLVPAEFGAQVRAGTPVTLRFQRSSEGMNAGYEDLKIRRAAYTLVADLAVLRRRGSVAGEGPEESSEAGSEVAGAFSALDDMERSLQLSVEAAGERREIPSGFAQAVPGILVMFTLLVLCTSGAVSMVVEREQGLLRRLASTPLRRGGIVLGKWGGKMVLGAVQISFAMLVGRLLFGMDWGPHLGGVLLVMFAWSALCASMGMLLGILARTQGQAVGIGVLASNILAALGGCWWPIEITPDALQSLQNILPTGWAMDALHQLVSFQSPVSAVLPQVAGMLSAAALLGWIATRRFRFD